MRTPSILGSLIINFTIPNVAEFTYVYTLPAAKKVNGIPIGLSGETLYQPSHKCERIPGK
jgi:hypothetical protein